jgi:hypothetical protein
MDFLSSGFIGSLKTFYYLAKNEIFPEELKRHDFIFIDCKKSEAVIPNTVHYIWLTSPILPKLPEDSFFYYNLKTNLKIMPTDSGYRHVIWTNIPKQMKLLLGESDNQVVEVRSFVEEKDSLPLFSQIVDAASRFNMGGAVDMFKYSVLFKEGGMVVDMNFHFDQRLDTSGHIFISHGTENQLIASPKYGKVIERVIEEHQLMWEIKPVWGKPFKEFGASSADTLFKYLYKPAVLIAKAEIVNSDDSCHFYNQTNLVGADPISFSWSGYEHLLERGWYERVCPTGNESGCPTIEHDLEYPDFLKMSYDLLDHDFYAKDTL